jgi:hypothetical protein
MLGARRLIIIALLGLFAAHSFAADTAPKSVEPLKSPTGAMLRSAIVPGWGQLYTHNYFKAFAFATAEVSIVYSASFQHGQMKRFQKAADNATDPSAKADYANFEDFYRSSRNRLYWWLAGVLLLSVGDAYVDAQLYGLDFSPDIGPTTGAAGISVSYKF